MQQKGNAWLMNSKISVSVLGSLWRLNKYFLDRLILPYRVSVLGSGIQPVLPMVGECQGLSEMVPRGQNELKAAI